MFNNIYKNKKVLITGNTGFKGSWLTVWLLKLGAKVYGLSKDIPTKPSMFQALDLEKKIIHYTTDIRNLSETKKNIEAIKPDFLFHLAAQSLVSVSYDCPVDTISTNVLGTANILESLRGLDHKCIGVIITSDKCYDNVEWVWGYKETDPLGGKDIYSGSKGAAELIIKSYYHSFFCKSKSKIRVASTRAGNVIGGGDWAQDRIIPDCIKSWTQKKTVEIRSPDATRPWQHVLEPLSGYLALGMVLSKNNTFNGQNFNFGPLAQYSQTVKMLIEDLCQYWDSENSNQFYKITDHTKFNEAGLLKLNCDKALLQLKWLPALEYEKLIEFTGKWYLNFYQGKIKMFDFTLSQIDEYEKLASDKEIQWARQK